MMIKDARIAANKTQRQLADETLLSLNVISRMENGRKVARVSFLRVCKALGVDPSQIEGVNITGLGVNKGVSNGDTRA